MTFDIVLSWLLIYALGYLVSLLFFKKMTFTLRLVLSFGFGTGFVSFLMAVLGVLYNFELVTFLLAYIILVVVLMYLNRKMIQIPKFIIKIRGVSKTSLLILGIISVFILSSLFHIIYLPDLYYDAPLYAQWAKILYNDKKIRFTEGGPTISIGFASNYPSAHQVLSVFIYFFTGESLSPIRITSLLIAFLMVMLVYNWSKELFRDKESHFYSILVFLSLPFIIFFSRTSSYYIYIVFHFSIACYFLQRFILKRDKKDLYLSGIFGGFVASASYLGLSFLLVLLLALQAERRFYKNLLVALFLFSLIASPWYLKNLIVLGNPLWPLGGGKYIDPEIRAHSLSQLNAMSKVAGFNYETIDDLKKSLTRLFFSYINPDTASIYHGVNPFFTLFAIPAVVLWIGTEKDKRQKKIGFFVLWFLISLAFYIVTSSYWNRYLITISIPTVFLSVHLISSTIDKSRKLGLVWGRLIRLSLALSLGVLYIFSIYLSLFWDEYHMGSIEQVSQSLGDHQKILEICYGDDFRIWTWVNGNLPEDASMATTDFIKLYYYERPVIEFNSWKLRGLQYSSSIEESVRILKENGIDYLALTGEIGEFKKYPQYFELVKEIDGKAVYKVI